MTDTALPAPLAGIRVLELADTDCGPYCGRLLADLGAEVIRVDRPRQNAALAPERPPDSGAGAARDDGFAVYVGWGKYSITLDHQTIEGRPLLRELVSACDAVICDMPPPRAEQLGLTYAAFSDANAGLVWIDITPFGSDGPWSGFAAAPLTTQSAAGVHYLQPTGLINAPYFGERPPVRWGAHASEFLAAVQAATAVLAALFERGVSGRGQRVEVSKQEALMHIIRSDIDSFAHDGTVRTRAGGSGGGRRGGGQMAISGTMRCKDGYVALWPLEPYMIVNLAKLMGGPPWSKEVWFEDPFERAAHSAEIRESIEAWLLDFTMEEAYALCQANRIAISPVYSPDDVARSPQLQERGFFRQPALDSGDARALAGLPFPTDFPSPGGRAAPAPGQHNRLVYGELLHHSDDELARLVGMGVI
jgi:crotonobetainyl-CoA:carnitine CoA-transferase CaiB-like acyl-CoA transferase